MDPRAGHFVFIHWIYIYIMCMYYNNVCVYYIKLHNIYIYIFILYTYKFVILYYTSSTAQGGGGSFKNRKPIGEVGCCESGMAERSH